MSTPKAFRKLKNVFVNLFRYSLISIGAITITSCCQNELVATDFTGHPIVGTWYKGSISGGYYNAVINRYEGSNGIGEIYYFDANGIFSNLIVFNANTHIWVVSISGRYSITDNKIKFTKQVIEESLNNGKTWSSKKFLPDNVTYFTTDLLANHMLMGFEGALPPLDPATNASKFFSANNAKQNIKTASLCRKSLK